MKTIKKYFLFFFSIMMLFASCRKDLVPVISFFGTKEITFTSAEFVFGVVGAETVTIAIDGGSEIEVSDGSYLVRDLKKDQIHTAVLTAYNRSSMNRSEIRFFTGYSPYIFISGVKLGKIDVPASTLAINFFTTTSIGSKSVSFAFFAASNYWPLVMTLKNVSTGESLEVSGLESITVNGLIPNTEYAFSLEAKDAVGNIVVAKLSVRTIEQFAVINLADSYEASSKATDKTLFGRSIAKAFVLDVLVPGCVDVDVIGTTTDGKPAVAYYWINNTDDSDINVACSTLGSKVPKTAITSKSFKINLQAGKNVICFKTAPFAGQIQSDGESGNRVGLKIKGENFLFENDRYVVDESVNVAGIQKIQFLLSNNAGVSANTELQNGSWNDIELIPYSDEAGTVYDGTLYPKILGLSLATTSDWSTGNVAGWEYLDFENKRGTSGKNFVLTCDDNGKGFYLFSNSNATFSLNILEFQSLSPAKLTKSIMGNYAMFSLKLNIFNNSSVKFGPANVCFVYKSARFVGNPETQVYRPDGKRIY